MPIALNLSLSPDGYMLEGNRPIATYWHEWNGPTPEWIVQERERAERRARVTAAVDAALAAMKRG